MSDNLKKALGAIQQGAKKRMVVLREKKRQLEEGEPSTATIPKLMGHIEKIESGDEETEGEEKPEGVGTAARKEPGETEHAKKSAEEPPRKQVTKLIAGLKEAQKQQLIKDQEQRLTAVKKQRQSEAATEEVNLEEVMLSPGEEVGEIKGYGWVYTKTHEQ